MVDKSGETPSTSAAASTDEEGLTNDEYTESSSDEDFSWSEDEEDAEMLQSIFEGVYCSSLAKCSAKNDPVERDSYLLFDKDLMENETGDEGNLSRVAPVHVDTLIINVG